MKQKIKCLVVDDEPMAREILEAHLHKVDQIELIASCKNALEAFKELNNHHIDLIFLDINMPEISGLSFAQSINKSCKVIFTTAYREYAVDGFDLQAVDYLLKPISFERLLQAVHKYINEIPTPTPTIEKEQFQEKNDFIFVRSDRKMIRIDFNEIEYIESFSDYLKIHLKTKTVLTRDTISSIEAKLPKLDFIRVHRSYIVSISAIESYTNEQIEINKKSIPISRSYRSLVLGKLE